MSSIVSRMWCILKRIIWDGLFSYHPAFIDKYIRNRYACSIVRFSLVVFNAVAIYFCFYSIPLSVSFLLGFGIVMVLHELNKSSFLKYGVGDL